MHLIHHRQRLFAQAFFGSRRRVLLLVLGVGVVGGLVGAAYVAALELMKRVLWPTHHAPVVHLLVLSAVGLGVGILTWVLGNPGDVELLVDNIHVLGGNQDVRDLRSLIPVSLLCISSGGAMGPEAPLVQTTGSLGSWWANRLKLTVEDTRILTITGMAAGFTVLFGAPLGSAIFALEILHRRGLEYYEALLPAVLGSLAGYAVYAAATHIGLGPVWTFPEIGHLRGWDLAWSLAAGGLGALVAAVFTFLNQGLRWAFRKLPALPRPVVGGVVLGLLGIWSPFALTYGELQINPMLAQRAVVAALAVAALAKLLGTSVMMSSGWRGGFIIPLLFIGVTLGRLGHALFPSTNEAVLMACLMAAINVGVTKTTIGTTLVVTEMAGLQLLPTTLIAAVLALILTSEVGLIHSQREREGALAPPSSAERSSEDLPALAEQPASTARFDAHTVGPVYQSREAR